LYLLAGDDSPLHIALHSDAVWKLQVFHVIDAHLVVSCDVSHSFTVGTGSEKAQKDYYCTAEYYNRWKVSHLGISVPDASSKTGVRYTGFTYNFI